MIKKIIAPIFMAFMSIGVMVSTELLLLFADIKSKIHNMNEISLICNHTLYRILIEIIVIGIILYVIIYRLIKHIEVAVKQLTDDAKKFKTDTMYIYSIRDYEIEEVRSLAAAFDYMIEELGSTIRKLKHQKEKLEIMIEALEEGIVVLNKEGDIGQINGLAKEMLHLQEDLKKKTKLKDCACHEKLRSCALKALKKGGCHMVEVALDDQIVFLSVVPIGKVREAYEYLLVIRDVTQLRKLEDMRSQFVSNVSHELKTPLTSIQGFVETLQSGAVENPKVAYKFLNIIDIETKRLYRLIQDILILSEIENMEIRQYGEADVVDIINEVIDLIGSEAKKKAIEISLEIQLRLKVKNISEDHIKQLAMNLISNAIKYTDHGKVKVIVGKDFISVEDTGIGIPEESVPHIFERFYRVDKSRSRQRGGTGLGLSIVKHIAQLYNLKIHIESKIGEGSKFTASIPKDKIEE
ncbi:PAS domain-containing sensor histidine kinase [Cellulosilyticum ruminicola]|uniref:PAS domain-containing sensor histidine kinase n=1 Tax=Cellulosilyticum ruminicola TaxID=425254 RepID=UPI0006D0E691|nr:ATP-binding protein [Cellulosilyticum ruminicola]